MRLITRIERLEKGLAERARAFSSKSVPRRLPNSQKRNFNESRKHAKGFPEARNSRTRTRVTPGTLTDWGGDDRRHYR
jgi:hypothetical protein